jgi:hypothetical protein
MISSWSSDSVNRLEGNYPYCRLIEGVLFDLKAFDDSTDFLLHFNGLSVDESSTSAYLIESPKNSKLRHQFEKGTITWTDFWSHRGWLIEFTIILFGDDPVKSRYLSFEEVTPEFTQELKKLDPQGGPYQIFHQNLVDLGEFEQKYASILDLSRNAIKKSA